jgi:hypothetical protein
MPGGMLYRGPLSEFFAGRDGAATADRVPAVLAWRAHLASKLGAALREPLAWPEEAGDAQRILLPARALEALRLLAVYADRAELELPDDLPPLLDLDPVWQQAVNQDFRGSRFAQVLAPDCWLPADFDLTLRHAYPDGTPAVFGSATALRFQLRALNRTTLQLDLAEIAEWRHGTVADPDLWRLAGIALASLRELLDRDGPGLPILFEA